MADPDRKSDSRCLRKTKRSPPAVRPPRGAGRGGIRRRRGRRARALVRRELVVGLVPVAGPHAELDGESLMFLHFGRHTLIEHLVERLRQCAGTILIGAPDGTVDRVRKILGDRAQVQACGAAYLPALRQLFDASTAPFAVVHEVMYPFAGPQLISAVIGTAAETGAAGAADDTTGPLLRLDGEGRSLTNAGAERAVIGRSPCAFEREVLAGVLRTVAGAGGNPVSAWELVRDSGTPIVPVSNDILNIPVASALDLEIARRVILPRLRLRRAARQGTAPGRGAAKGS
jgi:2-C-methyl-D-erythritol 4-phosphate cytidylyltransferase